MEVANRANIRYVVKREYKDTILAAKIPYTDTPQETPKIAKTTLQ